MIQTTTRNTKRPEHFYNSWNIRVYTPDGTMFVNIIEDHSNEPMRVEIYAAKNGTPLNTWCNCVENLVNQLLSLKTPIGRIIPLLDGPNLNKYAQNDNGIKIYSGPQGIQWALKQYLHMRERDSRRVFPIGR